MTITYTKPTLPKGTRDFGPVQMQKRSFILDTIKQVFKIYAYAPLETPSMENLSVLTGKYGDEGDQLIFKILNSGDFLSDLPSDSLEARTNAKKMLPYISEKALRYDLTVPFARYVVMNRNEITLPFKRYQIQPVWRADRPQKGRYREFYQCDADVVGTQSLLCEAEILWMIQEVFQKLGLSQVVVKLNNRKILSGMAEYIHAEGKEVDICVAIDKLDKIGLEGVQKELLAKGFDADQIDQLTPLLYISGDNDSRLQALSQLLANSSIGMEGIAELQEVLRILHLKPGNTITVELDFSLARGLTYYTGAIIEVKAMGVQIGSLCGGGRYDNLTGLFGMPGLSGVGISFGVDRIYDVLEELGLFPDQANVGVRVLVAYYDESTFPKSMEVLWALRKMGVPSEMYPKAEKMGKQFSYANAKNIQFVVIIGESELSKGTLSIKDMTKGQQIEVPMAQLEAYFNE